MGKRISDIYMNEVYKPKPEDERRFMDKHVVAKILDRNEVEGKPNGDDVFQATNVKTIDRKAGRMGHNAGEDKAVYEDADVENVENMSDDELLEFAMSVVDEAFGLAEMKNTPTKKLRALITIGDRDPEGMSPVFGMQIKAARKELARRKKLGTLREEEVEGVEEDVEQIDEGTKRLSKVHIVHHHDHPAAKQFADHYTAAMKGDHRDGGPTEADMKAADKFHINYSVVSRRPGFAGSGSTVYRCRKTGANWKVDRHPNGKTFYGTDHIISHDTSGLHEGAEEIHVSVEMIEEGASRSLASASKKYQASIDRSIRKAAREYNKHGDQGMEEILRRNDLNPKHMDKIKAHAATISRKKVAEETEQIDELSRSTLASYAKKAGGTGLNSAAVHAMQYARKMENPSNDGTDIKNTAKALRKSINRARGVTKAVDRLAKEDIINKALDKYIPEQYTFTPVERLLMRLEGVSEGHVDTLLSLFNSLNEHNQTLMIEQATTKEGVNKLIDFAINNRG